MSFTWVSLYEDLATRLLDYEHRQADLLALMSEIEAAGLPMVNLSDKSASGPIPLTEVDPFTVFASFNRRTTDANRLAVLDRIRAFLGSTTPLPTDFDGIPVADNIQSWFFPWAHQRRPDDLPSLWALARQAVTGGRDAIAPDTFDRCLRISSVKIAKLTMGLFWMRPRTFLPFDGPTQAHLRRCGVARPTRVAAWSSYSQAVGSVLNQLGEDFPAISLAAFLRQGEGRRYWAGGHLFDKVSKLTEFLEERTWYVGWPKDNATRGARGAWKRIPEIREGDWFAIKGLGGKGDSNYTLQVHALGQVDSIDADTGRITWTPLDLPLFHDRAPGKPGDGTWFESLCEVTTPEARAAIFGAPPRMPTSTTPRPEVKPMPRPTHPLNLILFGPPGTGKTFELRRMRQDFAIPTGTSEPRPTLDVADLTWFEVVALALHQIGRPAETQEIIDHALVQAKYVERAPRTRLSPFVWGQLQSHTVKRSTTVKYTQRTGLLIFDRGEDGRWFLPDGLPDELRAVAEPHATSVSPATGGDNQFTITFHPSFTYEDFVEGIRPETSDTGDEAVRYPLRPGVFKRACERAVQLAGFTEGLAAFCDLSPERRKELLAKAAPAALFIDEINRGNVARILGELITLIEPDKRLGASQEMIVTLPGSQARFGVPSNLWIIGTMNTADRSVVALDVALRRRFAFRECPPEPGLLGGVLVEGVELDRLLQTMNERIAVLRDRDHLIGHAFFWPLKEHQDRRTLDELKRVFHEAILPLLLEYFHDDLGRVGLVLGRAFVQRQDGAAVFADFDHDHKDDLAERPTWTLGDPRTLPAEAFRKIYA